MCKFVYQTIKKEIDLSHNTQNKDNGKKLVEKYKHLIQNTAELISKKNREKEL